jgi:hypothetical protein
MPQRNLHPEFEPQRFLRYNGINQTFWETDMQVSLTSASDRIIEQMMALGYGDPASLIEVALERMANQEMVEPEESPEYIEWMRHEVAIGAEAADRGDFYKGTLDDLKGEAFSRYQSRHQHVS